MSIHLSPELESRLAEEAEARGTTPDLLVEEFVRRSLDLEEAVSTNGESGGSLADFLAGYVGVFDSREDIPGGARMSEDTGRKFAEGMVRKREQGRL